MDEKAEKDLGLEQLGNPVCPGCGTVLTGTDLSNLRCPDCKADLPTRLGI